MALKRELILTIGGLLLLSLLLAFGAIGLFARMGPAIEHILEENLYSMVAGEQLLTDFARYSGPVPEDVRARLKTSLKNAEDNVTLEAEGPVLEALKRALPAAMEGDPEARGQVIRAATELIMINRRAVREVDREAQRMGIAGAWAAVFIGLISFSLSVFVFVRLQARFVAPLVDLYQVLEAARSGERLRRCRLADAPKEVSQVLESVNKLLDERLMERGREEG